MTDCEQPRKLYPLTRPQLGIWHTEKFHTGTGFGNIFSSTRISSKVDFVLLERAIQWAVETNDALRLRFDEIDSLPKQYIEAYEQLHVDHFNFSHPNGESAFSDWLNSQKRKNFKLSGSSLCYFATFCINDKESGFFVQAHHLISDGWSMVWLSDKIMECYSELRDGVSISRLPNPSYLDYVVSEQTYLESDRFQKQKNYWAQKFDSIPEFTALKPHSLKLGSTIADRVTFHVSTELTLMINLFCESAQVSPFIIFLAALNVYITRVTAKSDIVVGTPVLNRSNAREKETFGMFISMVPLRNLVDQTATVHEFIEQLSREWKAVLRNQKYSYDQIIKDFRDTHNSNDLLFDIVLSYQNAAATTDKQVDEHQIHWHHNGHQTETVAIHINDRNNTGQFEVEFDYLTDILSEAEVRTMWTHFLNILKDTLRHPDKILSKLEMLGHDEKNRILHDFNSTSAEYPKDATIHMLFAKQAAQTPFNIAVVDGNRELTYDELNEKSNVLAKSLHKQGIGPGKVASVMMEPSLEMIIAILGILKAGGAYVPIDADYPEDRILYMLADSVSGLLITDSLSTGFLNGIPTFTVSELLESCDSIKPIHALNHSKDAAYIIYTSGSSGKPKGVLVEHRSLINLCYWHIRRFEITQSDRATKYAGVGFDASVWEIFPYLVSGASIHIIEKQIRYDILKLNRYYKVHGITVSFLPTQICERFMELENDSLRYLLTGADKLNRFIRSSYKLVNNYGPTESTVVTTSFDVDRSYGNIPIGKPIDNTRVYILDSNQLVQPIGVPGELYIAGDGLAREYVGSRELTDEKFINGYIVGESRLYRTGDMARWRSDGNIEFLGRIDNQIKIRGYRIEMGEIEVCLVSAPMVREAVVNVREDGEHRYLCAHIVADQVFDTKQMKSFLVSKLPDYMIPEQFIFIDRIPLTPNGKIDRTKLLEGILESDNSDHLVEPETRIEKAIISLAEKILGDRRIGTNHNLVNVGFDSLMLIQLIAELGSVGLEISIQDFYDDLTVQDIARRIEECRLPDCDCLVYEEAPSVMDSIHTCSTVDVEESLNRILLTGSTGYLGIHLLRDLIKDTTAKITCLIRGEDRTHSEKRLYKAVRHYFTDLSQEQLDERVDVICGDISMPFLGLDETDYHSLGTRLDTVFNSAANVKHFGGYDGFESGNIRGVKNLIAFCEQHDLRLNQISTISVSGNYTLQKQENLIFSEMDLSIGQDISDNPYVKSKFEAEKQITQAIRRGVSCSVYRLGNLTGRYSDGLFQFNISDNKFYNFLRTILITETVPMSMLSMEIDMTPVDECSRAIVMLASKIQTRNQRYHLHNSQTISIHQMISYLSAMKFNIRPMKDSDFLDNLNIYSREAGDFELLKGFVGLSKIRNQSDKIYSVTVKSDTTVELLENQGFSWLPTDYPYLERIIQHICAIGFVKIL